MAYESFEKLKEKGYNGKLVNIFSIKPIDIKLINNLALNVKGMVTLENHSILGGLGGAIAEVIAQKSTHAPISYVGVEDVFTESGKAIVRNDRVFGNIIKLESNDGLTFIYAGIKDIEVKVNQEVKSMETTPRD